jgi:PDZ domain
MLEDGTPVRLRLSRTISSAEESAGNEVDFDVLEEVRIGDRIVIPKGSLARGTVTFAEEKRRMGRGGKLDVNIDSVRLANGQKAALRAVKNTKGGGHVGAMTGAIVVSAVVFWPAAPFFLMMHGKDITIPKGTEIAAYVNGNMNLDPTRFAELPASDQGATRWIGLSTEPRGANRLAITQIVRDGPADRAGLTVGDIVVQLSGKPVTSGLDFDTVIASCRPGSKVQVSYLRRAWQFQASIIIGDGTNR